MIPVHLKLKNFLSYREASLDFRGLHTACICGPNGSGKSSLLEAITWALWGQSRAAADDDIINAAAEEVRVDFVFVRDRNTYRAIRSKRRGHTATLDLQVQTAPDRFRTLSGRGIRPTQQRIDAAIGIDYDTFVNSAYLRQGRADEFMLRRPSERKQVLADLLKLDRYEALAERAKDFTRQLKAQVEQLERQANDLSAQLQDRQTIDRESVLNAEQLQELQVAQERDRCQLQMLQAREHQRLALEQRVSWHQQQLTIAERDCQRLGRDRAATQQELARLQQLLTREGDVTAGYRRCLELQREEAALSQRFQAYQGAEQQLLHLQRQQSDRLNKLQLQAQAVATQLTALEARECEVRDVLARSPDVATALADLHAARSHLECLEALHQQAVPLLQRRQHVQADIDRSRARLVARLEQLHATSAQLSTRVAQAPKMRSQAIVVETELKELETKQLYRQRVQEKGQERRNFQERLQESQRNYQKLLAELERKLELLEQQGAVCPLCDRPLDALHKQHVVAKTQAQRQEAQDRFWVLREQLATCERELQVLRGEYKKLSQDLAPFDELLQQRGQLAVRLETTTDVCERLKELTAERAGVEQSLSVGSFAPELHTELAAIDAELAELDYSEEARVLARSDVERQRRAEFEQAKIEDARRQQARIDREKPPLQQESRDLQKAVKQLATDSDLAREIATCQQQLVRLDYDRDRHNNAIAALRESQPWLLRHQQLQQARQQFPLVQDRLEQLTTNLQTRVGETEQLRAELAAATEQLAAAADDRAAIASAECRVRDRRQHLDELLARQGRLDQALAHLDTVSIQHERAQRELSVARRQNRVYRELAQAFGKNGIQACAIETLLPQLEAQTNHILARLTGNQLHVQFLTQKASKGRSKKQPAKTIETLEIRIADARGTRPYETYSGGEGFRINFAIRLALAKLLAQQSGTTLQMLIVDEGFGTQDAEGCDRLIAAIDAIAPDFACILAVTHMPQFKEAFQNRIEVRKTDSGSQLGIFG
ncbi:exonuclease SbcC [Rubidibacter lacunae KORDI 51-2]|uniref:Nuclease SbcCD subunit C n=1 Tax=Rubidibacter lacunae KORDI 51-2 TaxID=582515 RepID=U5DJS3_9CHRO|nr:exonuclease subunit SbcC [Rubidibacter lacunae]ERN41147.1 exonuclease SbcC [Rubidibacter lacunae KORDI 51-2]